MGVHVTVYQCGVISLQYSHFFQYTYKMQKWGGVTKPSSSMELFLQFSSIIKNTIYLLNIAYILDRRHHSDFHNRELNE